MAQVLIAGGSGLIGKRLTSLLLQAGHSVSWLSHSSAEGSGIRTFAWNPASQTYDAAAFQNTDVIISLAGSSVADKPWTADYKQEIINSRKNAALTLLRALQHTPHQIKCLIAASATGFYGNRDDEVLTEQSPAGTGFLPETTLQWEEAYRTSPVRTVLIRTGIVLSTNGGALPELVKPLQFGICPVLGSGKQFMPWIHIDDLCNMYRFAMENEQLSGVYNGVGPVPLKHLRFMKDAQTVLSPGSLRIPVPAFALRLLMGERAAIVTDSARVSPSKIMLAGFTFRFTELTTALRHLYGK